MRVYTEEKERGDNTSAESETPKKIDKEERGKDKTKKGKFREINKAAKNNKSFYLWTRYK